MSGSLLGSLALGFLLGLRHALDADHLLAVSAIVGREKSLWKSSIVGAIWERGTRRRSSSPRSRSSS